MSPADFTPLFLFVLVATISPGGATTLATASGASFGFRRSLPLLAGISIGLASMAALAAAGLAVLLLEHPALQITMKVAGSLYLMWLAWQIGRAGRPNMERSVAKPITFLGGIGLLWLNPKGWAMTLSAAASFGALADGPLNLAVILAATFAAFSATSLTLWCAVGFMLSKLLRTNAQWRTLNVALGILLAASVIPIWLD